MKVAIVCPFNIDRLTGSPKRAKTSIRAASRVAEVFSVSASGTPDVAVRAVQTGKVGLFSFTKAAMVELRHFDPDIVHGLSAASVPVLVFCRLMRPRAKVIYELHGWAWYEQALSPLWKRCILSMFDRVGL